MEIADAQDNLCRARDLVRLLFMAGESLNQNDSSAVTNACNMAEEILIAVRDKLDGVRERMNTEAGIPNP